MAVHGIGWESITSPQNTSPNSSHSIPRPSPKECCSYNQNLTFYRPHSKGCGKVMFSQESGHPQREGGTSGIWSEVLFEGEG